MASRGQTGLEYLLMIGGGVLLAAIVMVVVNSNLNTAADSANTSEYNSRIQNYLSTGPAGNDGDWVISGNDQFSGVPGNVGIGTANPDAKLEVNGNSKFNGIMSLSSNKITDLAAPFANTDAATKGYVDTYVDAASSAGPSCPDNYANLCNNGGGLEFTYNGKTLHIDAYPRAAAWYTSGAPSGQGLAWQMCQDIGARLPTLEEWQAACNALGGPNGNGATTFGGGMVNRWEWTAKPSSATKDFAVVVGGTTCTGEDKLEVIGYTGTYTSTYGYGAEWFRCIR